MPPTTPPEPEQGEITQLLQHWRGGDEQAREQLIRRVYDTLHKLADRQFARERSGHTLQPTALVHEAFMNLDGSRIDWRDRNHFYATVARAMRRLLVDHARARQRAIRGGDRIRVDLTGSELPAPEPHVDLLALDDALERLAGHSQRAADIMELTYFGGLDRQAVAEVLSIGSRTVDRDLSLARAWLRRQLDGEG